MGGLIFLALVVMFGVGAFILFSAIYTSGVLGRSKNSDEPPASMDKEDSGIHFDQLKDYGERMNSSKRTNNNNGANLNRMNVYPRTINSSLNKKDKEDTGIDFDRLYNYGKRMDELPNPKKNEEVFSKIPPITNEEPIKKPLEKERLWEESVPKEVIKKEVIDKQDLVEKTILEEIIPKETHQSESSQKLSSDYEELMKKYKATNTKYSLDEFMELDFSKDDFYDFTRKLRMIEGLEKSYFGYPIIEDKPSSLRSDVWIKYQKEVRLLK